jgi:hypothetical protein
VAGVALRPIEDRDLDALFDQARDPGSVRMAADATGRGADIEESILRLD